MRDINICCVIQRTTHVQQKSTRAQTVDQSIKTTATTTVKAFRPASTVDYLYLQIQSIVYQKLQTPSAHSSGESDPMKTHLWCLLWGYISLSGSSIKRILIVNYILLNSAPTSTCLPVFKVPGGAIHPSKVTIDLLNSSTYPSFFLEIFQFIIQI